MKLKIHISFILICLLFSCTTYNILESQENEIITVKDIKDENITSIIHPYKMTIDSLMNEVLCFSSIEMTKSKPLSLIGNFVTDLCLEMYDTIADICIMNNGGLRSTLPYGDITRGDIYKLMPFENELVILELNLIEIFKLSKYIISRGGEPFSGFDIYYSGDSTILIENHWESFSFMHENKSDSVFVNPMLCTDGLGGWSISLDDLEWRTWKVLTSDYLANGGDNMDFFVGKNQFKTGVKVRDVIINYCISKKEINAKLDSRIIIDIIE